MRTYALLLASLCGAFATPSLLKKRQIVIKQGEGIGSDGFFHSVWDDGNMQQTFTDRDGGFDLTWSGNGDVVAGKGWQEGTGRNITYSGTYTTGGMSFLMIYGWFENPLVEYYVMENWDDRSDPSKDSDMQYITTLNSDGADYDVFKKVQVNWPSIIGTATFDQYRSVRKTRRTSGTVNMANHFAAWRAAGFVLNEVHYQIVGVEGMQANSSGQASISIAPDNSADIQIVSSSTPVPITTSRSPVMSSSRSRNVKSTQTARPTPVLASATQVANPSLILSSSSVATQASESSAPAERPVAAATSPALPSSSSVDASPTTIGPSTRTTVLKSTVIIESTVTVDPSTVTVDPSIVPAVTSIASSEPTLTRIASMAESPIISADNPVPSTPSSDESNVMTGIVTSTIIVHQTSIVQNVVTITVEASG